MLLPEVAFLDKLLFSQLVWVLCHGWVDVEFEEEFADFVEWYEEGTENHTLVEVPLSQDKPNAVDALFVEKGPSVIHYHPDDKGPYAGCKNCENQKPSDVARPYDCHQVCHNDQDRVYNDGYAPEVTIMAVCVDCKVSIGEDGCYCDNGTLSQSS